MRRAFQKKSRTNKAARQKQPYNHSSGSKSFLQRQHKLAEQRRELVDRMELFRTPVPAYPEGNQPLFGDEICETVLGRRFGYLKDLGWGPKSKAHKTTSAVVPRHLQSTIELQL
ncbi:CACTA en-spm transposon protein [Cucumis melo var. makuwa]|uniref:CACTA en-spm transposon protein n=1 Tax=Cucumis melo var. makuwa TaxID=1194695 RepID=A0A5A7U3V0_CUCMM|nr:CACTA en-spm transposon protein [Cucumis melo var. makuwa]